MQGEAAFYKRDCVDRLKRRWKIKKIGQHRIKERANGENPKSSSERDCLAGVSLAAHSASTCSEGAALQLITRSGAINTGGPCRKDFN